MGIAVQTDLRGHCYTSRDGKSHRRISATRLESIENQPIQKCMKYILNTLIITGFIIRETKHDP
jgi:hypothetical protein